MTVSDTTATTATATRDLTPAVTTATTTTTTERQATMRAIQFTDYGQPAVLETVELPRPEAGPGEVLVRVAGTTFNQVDAAERDRRPQCVDVVGGGVGRVGVGRVGVGEGHVG